jgi:hypothetical protein
MPMKSVRTPFANMTFSPDVPSTALGPNEYNSGYNVETDVRGIRSVNGSQEILAAVPGTPTFISGGYREDGNFWFIVATDEGYWWAAKDATGWTNITPPQGPYSGYNQATNITDAWNGTVPFFNDSLNPPLFWGNGDAALTQYSNQFPASISSITTVDSVTQQITLNTALTAAPYVAGERISISGTGSNDYNGIYTVVSSTTSTINYLAQPASAFPNNGGSVAPKYSWNYNQNWNSVYAGWMRLYSTPNVGSILVAGNLTANLVAGGNANYPVTVQWSQAFGLNQAPLTWTPTVTNVANQLEVPLRGACVDAFPCNGQFFLCSYWDTVVFSPINYSTTSSPILGVRLFTQGRGLLSSNCWANTDKQVYGVDARDIWVFDGSDFKGIGNQRVKNWFYDQLNPAYVDRVFMDVNTQKNQIELYYPTVDAYNGVPNKMISYRYDIDCWNAPRDIASATMTCESPVWISNVANYGSRTIVYARGQANVQILQKDQGFTFSNNTAISSSFRRDNIKLSPDYNNHVMVHRILPETVNLNSKNIPLYPSPGNVTVTVEGAYSVGSIPSSKTPVNVAIATDYPWAQIDQNEFRVNTLEITNTSNTNVWMCSAVTWQVTQVEDDR